MKTVQDYLNDPRITNDPGLMSGPEEIRTIHAIRLKRQDETAGMTMTEKVAFLNKGAEAFLSRMGKSLCYDLTGKGKLKPGEAIGV